MKALPNEVERYLSGIANNSPEIFSAMTREYSKVNENKRVFSFGEPTDQALVRVLVRWAKAFHYRETGSIVPPDSRLFVDYFTNYNVHLIPTGALDGKVHELKRNGRNIGDQFLYITKNDLTQPDLGYYTIAFRRSFLAIMMVDYAGKVIPQDRST